MIWLIQIDPQQSQSDKLPDQLLPIGNSGPDQQIEQHLRQKCNIHGHRGDLRIPNEVIKNYLELPKNHCEPLVCDKQLKFTKMKNLTFLHRDQTQTNPKQPV